MSRRFSFSEKYSFRHRPDGRVAWSMNFCAPVRFGPGLTWYWHIPCATADVTDQIGLMMDVISDVDLCWQIVVEQGGADDRMTPLCQVRFYRHEMFSACNVWLSGGRPLRSAIIRLFDGIVRFGLAWRCFWFIKITGVGLMLRNEPDRFNKLLSSGLVPDGLVIHPGIFIAFNCSILFWHFGRYCLSFAHG